MDVRVNRSRTFTNITHVTQHCGNRCTDPKNRFFGNFSCYSFLQLEDVKIQFQNFILIYKVGLWTFSWGVEVTYLGQNRVFNRIRYWLFCNYKTEGFCRFLTGIISLQMTRSERFRWLMCHLLLQILKSILLNCTSKFWKFLVTRDL